MQSQDQQFPVYWSEKSVIFFFFRGLLVTCKLTAVACLSLAPAGLEIRGLEGDDFSLLSEDSKYLCLLLQLTEWFMVRM
jgi:hypothetical protein